MKTKPLIRQIYPPYLLVTLLCMIAVGVYAANTLRHFFIEQTRSDLIERANLLAHQIGPLLSSPHNGGIDLLSREIGNRADTRITVILANGDVRGDSEADPNLMEKHLDRPEVADAFSGKIGSIVRYSWTLKQDMIYVAIPLERNGSIDAVLRTAAPLTDLEKKLKRIYGQIFLGGLAIATIAVILSILIARNISRPIEEIRQGAEQFARGNLRHRLPKTGFDEIAGLSETINGMAGELEKRIQTISRQRNELEAVLSSMVEAVIAIDSNERVISMNAAARKMFAPTDARFEGRIIQELIRNVQLHEFVRKALSTLENIENDIVLNPGSETIVHARSTMLRGAGELYAGILIVMNDVTQIRKLENMRRDFAANVSHELKTPLTAIRGFVETLQQQKETDNPEQTERFLQIIARHVDRLNRLIDDLMSLSRIEQEKQIHPKPARLKAVLHQAVQICGARAREKDIQIHLDCPDDLEASVDSNLIEQAVVNLLDNAVAYSDQGSEIRIEAVSDDTNVIVRCKDRGIGIEKKHLPRIFERFYRVEKARSRKMGGTGLGLAIVKHIARAHGGRVTVESALGQGSIFSIYLPRRI